MLKGWSHVARSCQLMVCKFHLITFEMIGTRFPWSQIHLLNSPKFWWFLCPFFHQHNLLLLPIKTQFSSSLPGILNLVWRWPRSLFCTLSLLLPPSSAVRRWLDWTPGQRQPLVTSQGDDALVCAFALTIRHAPDSLIYIEYTDANTHTNIYTDTSH